MCERRTQNQATQWKPRVPTHRSSWVRESSSEVRRKASAGLKHTQRVPSYSKIICKSCSWQLEVMWIQKPYHPPPPVLGQHWESRAQLTFSCWYSEWYSASLCLLCATVLTLSYSKDLKYLHSALQVTWQHAGKGSQGRGKASTLTSDQRPQRPVAHTGMYCRNLC